MFFYLWKEFLQPDFSNTPLYKLPELRLPSNSTGGGGPRLEPRAYFSLKSPQIIDGRPAKVSAFFSVPLMERRSNLMHLPGIPSQLMAEAHMGGLQSFFTLFGGL